MKAIVWKEIRANLIWALSGMIAMSIAMAFVLWDLGLQSVDRDSAQSICSEDFQVVTICGFCGIGLLLGILQIWPELSPDRRAFLIHRPVSAAQIFGGKVCGGLALYLVATAVPLAGGILWAATPGHMATPFEWRMVLPSIADLLSGTVFYFAGILTMVRQVRWYGSRALAIPAACVCVAAVAGVPTFLLAIIVAAVSVAVMGLAARGSFITGGQYRSQPTPPKAALGTILLAGICIVGAVGFVCVVGTFMDTYVPGASWTRYFISEDGRILREVSTTIGRYRATSRSFTLDGQPANYPDRLCLLWLRVERPGRSLKHYRFSSNYYSHVDSDLNTNWYYVFRTGRIAGYSRDMRLLSGTIGPDGFVPAGEPTTDRFAHPPLTERLDNYLIFPDAACYYLNLDYRGHAHKALEAKPNELFQAGGKVRYVIMRQDYRYIAVGAQQSFYLLDPVGKVAHQGQYDGDLIASYPNVSFAMTPKGDRQFLWYSPSYRIPQRARKAWGHVVVEMDAEGQELARHEVPSDSYRGRSPARGWGLLGLVVPVGSVVFFTAVPFIEASIDGPPPYVQYRNMADQLMSEAGQVYWIGMIAMLVGAVICVIVCLTIARRYAFTARRTRWWAVLAFFTGPAGLLTMWSLLDWPAREDCPGCGRKRVVSRDFCEHCDAPFARPAPDGTEILDYSVLNPSVAGR